MALHDGYLSDHRALLVGLDAQSLFTSDTSPVTLPVERRLMSTSPRAVHTYINSMKVHFGKHDIASKVHQLQRLSETGQWSDECVQEWECLDKLLSEARLCVSNGSARQNGQDCSRGRQPYMRLDAWFFIGRYG